MSPPVEESHQLHLLPCTIDYKGRADIDKYFTVTPYEDKTLPSDCLLEGSLRGRLLVGSKVELPEQLTGIIVDENLATLGTFPSTVSWQCDQYKWEECIKLKKQLACMLAYQDIIQ